MSATATVARHHVTLTDESRIAFDYVDGKYRLVLYRRRRIGERSNNVDAATFDYLVAQRILPHSYRTGWTRFAVIHESLVLALAHVLERATVRKDPREIERYIRAMPWGGELP